MPGIAGIIQFDPQRSAEEIREELESISRLLSAHPGQRAIAEVASFEHGAMAAVRLEDSRHKSLCAEDAAATLVFWGHLWDEDELRRKSGMAFKSLREAQTGAILLKIYRKEGMAGLCELNGRFVIALWDKNNRRLHLACDRYGFTKLYLWSGPDQVRFASEYKAIIRSSGFSGKIDEQALADFVTFGYPTGDKTFFQDIKLLPQASVMTFEKGKTSVHRYWDYTFHKEDDPMWDEEDYVDQFFSKLETATKRQVADLGAVSVPISGGYDSRTLAAMLEKIGFNGKVETFSMGGEYSFDVLYGREIARKLGFNHAYVPIDSTVIRDHSERFVWLLEGTVSCINSHMLLAHQLISESGPKSIMTGFFGDVTCGTDWSYVLGLRGSTNDDEIVSKQYPVYADIMRDGELKDYMNGHVYEKVQNRPFETFKKRYFSCPSGSRYYKSRYFSLHERQRRYTSFNLFAFDPVGNVVSPFLDKDFVDFAYRLPPHLAIHSNLYRKMIIKYLPKVAAAKHNDTRLPINASELRKGLQWRWERILKNPLIRATIGSRYSRMNDNYMNTDNAIRNGSRDFVLSNIRDNPFLSEYFDMDRVHKMLEEHMDCKRNEYGKIMALLTLSLWHKLFVEGQGYRPGVGK